jgi:hypothetical protein
VPRSEIGSLCGANTTGVEAEEILGAGLNTAIMKVHKDRTVLQDGFGVLGKQRAHGQTDCPTEFVFHDA